MYWYHLVLSTITQTRGTHEGRQFVQRHETLDGRSLGGNVADTQRTSKHGTPDEYTDIINHVQNGHTIDGSCAMTFMWGDLFCRSKAKGGILHDKLGIAPTPGSEVVFGSRHGQIGELHAGNLSLHQVLRRYWV